MSQMQSGTIAGMAGTGLNIGTAMTGGALGVTNSAGDLATAGATLAGQGVQGGFNPGPTNSESGQAGSGNGITSPSSSNMPSYFINNAAPTNPLAPTALLGTPCEPVQDICPCMSCPQDPADVLGPQGVA